MAPVPPPNRSQFPGSPTPVEPVESVEVSSNAESDGTSADCSQGVGVFGSPRAPMREVQSNQRVRRGDPVEGETSPQFSPRLGLHNTYYTKQWAAGSSGSRTISG